jgi:hypothetical protein
VAVGGGFGVGAEGASGAAAAVAVGAAVFMEGKPHGIVVKVVAGGEEESRMEGKPLEAVEVRRWLLLIGGVVGGIGSIGLGDEMGQLRKRSIGRSGWSRSISRSSSER